MYIGIRARSCAWLPLIAAGLLASGAAVAAEKATGEEITVVAPRLVQKEVVGTTPVGAKVELVSLTRRVSYADLDLKVPAKADELRKRIKDTAKEACEQIAKLYPLADTHSPDCVEQATEEAMAQAKRAIASAQ